MLRPVVLLAAICSVYSSGVGVASVAPPAPIGQGPVVTAASSQYFERTFNRLVAAPPPFQPVFPVAPLPQPVFVHPVPNAVPVAPAPPQILPAPPQIIPAPPSSVPALPQPEPVQPNVAIAVATAHAAAPVATFLLPPYPFGPPPVFGFVPSGPPANIPEEKPREQTTPSTDTTEAETTTTEKEQEATTPEPSNSDNSFVQALPSNENVNFNQIYGPPPQQSWPQQRPQEIPLPPHQTVHQQGQFTPQNQPLPSNSLPLGHPLPGHHQQPWSQKSQQNQHNYWPQKARPQKLKTSVEVVKVPLAYIAPPPFHTHEHVKVIKNVYGFAPHTKSKIIVRTIRTPGRIVTYTIPIPGKIITPYIIRAKDQKLTTLKALYKQKSKQHIL